MSATATKQEAETGRLEEGTYMSNLSHTIDPPEDKHEQLAYPNVSKTTIQGQSDMNVTSDPTIDKKQEGPIPDDASMSMAQRGPLLYEISHKEIKENCLCTTTTGEDSVLQFYEHLVVLRRTCHNGLFPKSYEMKVIPRFKIVGAQVKYQAESVPSWKYALFQFGILGLTLYMIGYILFFVVLLIGGVNALSTYPCLVTPSQKYFLTLDVLHTGPSSHFFADCFAALLRRMRWDGENPRVTPVVFKSLEELDEDFIISYAYGILNSSKRSPPAHMTSHLNTAANITSASLAGLAMANVDSPSPTADPTVTDLNALASVTSATLQQFQV